jgi:hypothetical protein
MTKKAEAEIWIQHSAGNTVSGNIICLAPGGRMVSAVEGGVKNVLDNNVWHSPGGETAMPFVWAGEEGTGMAEWRRGSGQDSSSVFKAPSFPNPELGDFGTLPWDKPAASPGLENDQRGSAPGR